MRATEKNEMDISDFFFFFSLLILKLINQVIIIMSKQDGSF